MKLRRKLMLVGAVGALALACALCSAVANASIVGRWHTHKTCHGLVKGLTKFNLQAIAPAFAVDFFPNRTPKQLAQKRHLCRGATGQRHSHFFVDDGRFGSLDQHNQQVDDGSYRVKGGHKLRIGGVKFHFRIHRAADGDVLRMRPVITRRMRRQALAHPLDFTDAGWAVSVAYPGHTWKRGPCPGCTPQRVSPRI